MRNEHTDSHLSFQGLYSTKIDLPLPLPLFRVMNVLLQITKGLLTTMSKMEIFHPTQVQPKTTFLIEVA